MVVVESASCSNSVQQPPTAKGTAGVLGSHAERIGRLVVLTLRVGLGQETTCEIVLRDYSHRKHPIQTRTRYCRSKVRRGRWELRGPAQHLPRWAILTGSTRPVSLQVSLSVLSPVTEPIAHATIYLSDGARKPLKVITNAHGSATVTVPYGPTRVLAASYPGEGDYSAAVSRVEAQFQASTSDFASPRQIAPGQPVTFSGALLGAPLPKGPAPAAKILVQYRSGRRWVTWGTTHTNGAKWHITLRLGGSPRAVATRAVVLPALNYRYVKGASRIVHLYVIH